MSKKKYNRRKRAVQERDQHIVAKYYLRGLTLTEIVKKRNEIVQDDFQYNFDAATNDLKRVRRKWIKSTLINFNEKQAIEVAKVDELEKVYWNAWQESRGEREIITEKSNMVPTGRHVEIDDDGQVNEILDYEERLEERTIRKDQSPGDPRYLEGVRWCITKRLELFGLIERAEMIKNQTNIYAINDGETIFDAKTIDERRYKILTGIIEQISENASGSANLPQSGLVAISGKAGK